MSPTTTTAGDRFIAPGSFRFIARTPALTSIPTATAAAAEAFGMQVTSPAPGLSRGRAIRFVGRRIADGATLRVPSIILA